MGQLQLIKCGSVEVKPQKALPTVHELIEYGQSIGLSQEDCEYMYDYYESIGWIIGRSRLPVKSWKATVRNWLRNQKRYAQPKPKATQGDRYNAHGVHEQYTNAIFDRLTNGD